MEAEVHDEKVIQQTKGPKRIVIINQHDDNSFSAEYSGVAARQHLLPMLKFAERNFRLRLARHEVS